MKNPRLAILAAALAGAWPTGGFAGEGQPTLLGWNNLGMHCMDDDYSVFSILPPYNTIDAHLIDANGKLVKSGDGITLTFEGIADPDGSINRTVAGKTNFREFVQPCYGATLPLKVGLTGVRMPGPGNIPQPLTFSGDFNWFEGLGIPIIPVDDAGRRNPYPLLRLTARNAAGAVLATSDVVAPVSGEMDCRACHGSNAGDAAKPAAGWVNEPHASRDYRLNILRLHDEKHLADPVFQDALALNHFRPEGLYATATEGATPILCAKCHLSEALPFPGAPDTSALTRAIHHRHENVINPSNGLTLNNSANRSACYTCHPGSATRCLRGAMGGAVAADGTAAMQCQSCHGRMKDVGAATRTGWLDEPNCQQCHTGSATLNNGQIRYTSVFETDGTPRVPVNSLFATNPDTPDTGLSLYRFSKGHDGLQCSACHGSTHAEFPATHRNDNLQSAKVQGHAGVVADCTACHAAMPSTVTGGPHGMHPAGQSWISAHQSNGKSDNCKACHGADYRGTVLSRMFAGYTGPDLFTFAAFDGFTDSNLGTVSVNVGDPAVFADRDSDGDGITDLIEYALGLSPDFPSLTPATSATFQTVAGQSYLTLSVPRALAPTDVTLEIEVSSDMTTWQPATITVNTPWLLEARDPLSADESARGFIRLKATR